MGLGVLGRKGFEFNSFKVAAQKFLVLACNVYLGARGFKASGCTLPKLP